MKKALLAPAMFMAFCFGGALHAAPVFSSSAEGASVDIAAANVVKASVVFAAVSDSAPPAYDVNGNLLTIDQNAQLVLPVLGSPATNESLTTGVVTTRAFSNAGSSSATGSATINDTVFSLSNQLLVSLTALGISADTITSTTTAGIDAGSLYANGSSSIEGLTFSGLVPGLLAIDGSLFANASANTVLFDNLGLTITLNEQKSIADATSVSMFTNALHVSLNDFLLNGQLLTGDIIVGHSQAGVSGFAGVTPTAAPEPATWAMMVIGFGLVGATMRGHRRRLIVAHA